MWRAGNRTQDLWLLNQTRYGLRFVARPSFYVKYVSYWSDLFAANKGVATELWLERVNYFISVLFSCELVRRIYRSLALFRMK